MFKADAGFIESLDRKDKRSTGGNGSFNDFGRVKRFATIKKVDLTIGLWVYLLLNQFSGGKFSKTHSLGNAIYFFEMSVKEVS